MNRPRLAIIGTGIAGLGCAHLLQQRFDLTLFEQNDHIGGHTNTVTVREGAREVPVDTGFMVFNHVTYPLLTRLFRELGVETKPTDMSFSVRHDATGIEYNGGSLEKLFGQRRNLVSPRFWKFILQINRFNEETVAALQQTAVAAYQVDTTGWEAYEDKETGVRFMHPPGYKYFATLREKLGWSETLRKDRPS